MAPHRGLRHPLGRSVNEGEQPKVAPWRAAVAYACDQQFDMEPITDPVEMQILSSSCPGRSITTAPAAMPRS